MRGGSTTDSGAGCCGRSESCPGDVVGFGARRLFDDDRIEAKYLNTPETPIYKKSQLLYGVDLARKEIARSSQAVVVEGYTDVMACHLAGVTTAVATCGTAFGEDHTRILRRLLLDHDEFRGEVIFTFDGDAAGQKAALRAFEGDQQFVGQTYVSVEPDGRDPCDLRLAEGDAAVRELIARRVPLYRFVLGNVVSRFDLDRADSRVDAIREAAKLVASVRDGPRSRRSPASSPAWSVPRSTTSGSRCGKRCLASEVAALRPRRRAAPAAPSIRPEHRSPANVPDPRERRYTIERDVLKLAFQHPAAIAPVWSDLEAEDFTHPYYQAIFTSLVRARWAGWRRSRPRRSRTAIGMPADLRRCCRRCGWSSCTSPASPTSKVAAAYVVRLRELTALRRIEQIKSKLQRTNPVTEVTEYNRMFGELVALGEPPPIAARAGDRRPSMLSQLLAGLVSLDGFVKKGALML